MKRITYVAVIEEGDRGFGAYFPDLPGCATAGDTIAETIALASEALQLHVLGMREDCEILPEPTGLDDIPMDPEVREIKRELITAAIHE
ncbi:type II toxin-antitoxin system HicB family antitoxin [Novosphingobium sp. PS1R-30]|uniref:Type II toxin-antitoxin system HicB family antitoxin n=1 Tax=Novosphingobium anseongense TaxID=3133436 RepID=A0ABU8S1M4_9SPHN